MEGNFNMRKIHAGYVVEFRNGQRAMAMRYDNGNMAPNLFFVIPGMHRGYGRLSDWYADTMNRATPSPDFTLREDLDIVRVYGYPKVGSPVTALFDMTATACLSRNVIWERKEAVKMTLAQVCEKLGYDVEIVKEGMENAE